MKLSHFFAASALLLVTTSVAAKQETIVICHVGSEAGPTGETYLEDPAYDAGKIDLIVVTKATKHLDNPSHCWGDLCDYEPDEKNATGYGTEDSNGDGVDDGCEPVRPCPCWDAIELLAVTAENQHPEFSCSSGSEYPVVAGIASWDGEDPLNLIDGFAARDMLVGHGHCSTTGSAICDNDDETGCPISPEEALACVEQIAIRCAAIGDPIYP